MTTTETNDSVHSTIPTGLLARSFLNSSLPIGELREQVGDLLSREDLPKVLKGSAIDWGDFVDKIHEVYLIVGAQEKRLLDLLENFYKVIKQFPDSVLLSEELETSDTIPITQKGFMDIWPGRYRGACIVIKFLRASSTENSEEMKEILRTRAPTWKKLDHANIAAFHGIMNVPFRIGLVYGWEENCNILRYVDLHPEARRLALLLQVAEGLRYLHSLGLTHGDLLPINVLVSDFGHVRLTDYGFAPLNAISSLIASGGNARCLAPELIDPPSNRADIIMESQPADIFAFGILSFQVFTGKPPFGDPSELAVSRKILGGASPEFPCNAETVGLTVEVQGLLRRCWDHDPAQRMTIDEVVELCNGLLGGTPSPQPTFQPEEVAGQPTHPAIVGPQRGTKSKWRRMFNCGLW